MHLMEFCWGDGIEAAAMDVRLTVFDFSEVDVVTFGADDVDFVEVGFVVPRDDLVTVGF